MLRARLAFILSLACAGAASGLLAQNHASALPTSQLLSQPGPTFTVKENELRLPVTVITYGDMRFTDPANVTATNPLVRKWLVQQIATEHPDAVLLNGDVPLAGDLKNDYQIYKTETEPWRNAKLHVYPALGNHEFHGPDPQQCLENWWSAFPEMRNRRWYSTQLGTKIYSIAMRRCCPIATRRSGSPSNYRTCRLPPTTFF